MAKNVFKELILVILLLFFLTGTSFAATLPQSSPGLKRLSTNLDRPLDFIDYRLDYVPGKFYPTLRSSDDFRIKWRINSYLPSNLVVNDEGTMFIGDRPSEIHAVDRYGKQIWFKALKKDHDVPTLALGKSGTLFAVFGGDISDKDSSGIIMALTSKGQEKWSAELKRSFTWYYDENTFSEDNKGNFIIPTRDGIVSFNQEGYINWLNKEIRTYKEEDDAASSIRRLRTDNNGNIYLLTMDRQIISLDTSGNLRWEIVHGRKIDDFYLNQEGQIYTRDMKGTYIYDASNGQPIIGNQSHTGKLALPWSWDGGAYFTDDADNFGIKSLDNNGKVKWIYKPNLNVSAVQQIVADNKGNVYFCDWSGNIYALDKYGNEQLVLARKSGYTSVKLFINNQGELIVLSDEIGLLAIGRPEVGVFIGNKKLEMPVTPFIENGSTLVPFRSIFEKLGLKVDWDNQTQTVTGTKAGLTIKMRIGEKTAIVNGITKQMVVAPKIVNGSTFIPLRFVGESSGLNVQWDSRTLEVYIGTEDEQILTVGQRYLDYLATGDLKGLASLYEESTLVEAAWEEEYYRYQSINIEPAEVKLVKKWDDEVQVQLIYKLYSVEGQTFQQSQVDKIIYLKKMSNGAWKIKV